MSQSIRSVAGIVAVATTSFLSSGRLAAQDVVRLEGRALSTTPVIDPEHLPRGPVDERVRAMLTTGGDTVVPCVAYSPDGRRLAAGRKDSTIRLWEMRPGAAIPSCTLRHNEFVVALAFSPDVKYLAACDRDRTIIIWGADTGREAGRITSPTDWFTSLAFSPDGRSLAGGNRDASISIFALEKAFRPTR
jgi:WD40 repeat protein